MKLIEPFLSIYYVGQGYNREEINSAIDDVIMAKLSKESLRSDTIASHFEMNDDYLEQCDDLLYMPWL